MGLPAHLLYIFKPTDSSSNITALYFTMNGWTWSMGQWLGDCMGQWLGDCMGQWLGDCILTGPVQTLGL